MRHASSKTGFFEYEKDFFSHRQVEKVNIFLKSMLQKAPKSFFWSIAALYKTHTAWPVPTSGVFVQHRSSEARPCRYFTAFASDRPLSVEQSRYAAVKSFLIDVIQTAFP